MKKKRKRKKLNKKVAEQKPHHNINNINIRVNSDGGNDADKSLNKLKSPIY